MTSDDFKKLLDESKESIERSLKEIREEQRVLPSLIYVETTVKSYADNMFPTKIILGDWIKDYILHKTNLEFNLLKN